jgi:hypothetical protein
MSDYDGQNFDGEGDLVDAFGEPLSGDGGEGEALTILPRPAANAAERKADIDAIDRINRIYAAQALNAGSQGQARPAFAADVATAQNRIAKILASGLKGLEESSGLERIGSAAMQTLAGQGKVSFPQAEAAIQQQDLSRAYNIANALSGLAKSQNAGQLTPNQLLQVINREREVASREQTAFRNSVESFIRTISSRYENPAKAAAIMRDFLVENDKGITDYATGNRLMAEAARRLSESGERTARSARGAGAGGGAGGEAAETAQYGLYYDEASGEAKWRPFRPAKAGATMPEWMSQANYIARQDGPEAANEFVLERSRKTSGAQATDRQQAGFRFREGQAENAATRSFSANEDRMIGNVARRYGEKSSEVEAAMRDFIQNQYEDNGVDPNNFVARRRIFTDAIRYIGEQGFVVPPQNRRAASDPQLSAVPMTADGKPDYTKTIPNPKTEWARTWNSANLEQRADMWQRKIGKATESGNGLAVVVGQDGTVTVSTAGAVNAGMKSAQAEFDAAEVGYKSVKPVLDRMITSLQESGGAVIGPAATLSRFAGFIKDQSKAIFGDALPADLRGSDEQIASRFDNVMRQAGLERSGIANLLSSRADQAAQTMKTNMIFAVYYIAKTLDGRGALSNNDTRQVLSALGGNWTSSDAAIAAIKAADQILVDRLNARREKFEQYQRGLQQPRGAAQAPAPSAGSQPGAQPGGQGTGAAQPPPGHVNALRGWASGSEPLPPGQTLESAKAAFDKRYGAGAADRVLGGGR